ncbi:disulfide bond formation protein B [Desertibaculum subflavum]|uniref:disulfide bond formation protein B n=1 Tax=Desertibaculum subflavum TaxID=2268458 RepID=UPI000E663774
METTQIPHESVFAGTSLRRFAPAAVIAASVAMLAGAFYFQYVMGLAPCPLCIWQRWAYAPPILIGLAGILLPQHARPLVLLAGLAFLAGAGIAGFHTGVELGWWQGLAECSGTTGGATSLEDLRKQLMAAPLVRCDEVPWSFIGISMAGWNMIAQVGFAAACLWAARRMP